MSTKQRIKLQQDAIEFVFSEIESNLIKEVDGIGTITETNGDCYSYKILGKLFTVITICSTEEILFRTKRIVSWRADTDKDKYKDFPELDIKAHGPSFQQLSMYNHGANGAWVEFKNGGTGAYYAQRLIHYIDEYIKE